MEKKYGMERNANSVSKKLVKDPTIGRRNKTAKENPSSDAIRADHFPCYRRRGY